GLARTGLAHQAQPFAWPNKKADAVYRAHRPGGGVIADAQVPHVQYAPVTVHLAARGALEPGIGDFIERDAHLAQTGETDGPRNDRWRPPPPHPPQQGRVLEGVKERSTDGGAVLRAETQHFQADG